MDGSVDRDRSGWLDGSGWIDRWIDG
jgi:hypothetical protein